MQQHDLNRRSVLGLGLGGAAIAVVGARVDLAHADVADLVAQRVADFAGDAEITEGGVTVDAPEIAENGNTVPVGVLVDSAMEGDDMALEVLVLADGNPAPGVATFKFSAMSGEASATTRIRLARTQNVHAYAKMADGSVRHGVAEVKVTIGGCGG